MTKVFSLLDPNLLCAAARKQPLLVFLCGPGEGSPHYELRQTIKRTLESFQNVKARYGEEIDARKLAKKGLDLQTIEAQFAHSVDFTMLMLESPGAIAELGTFSMISNIRSRLFVVVSSQYYEATSYIARGPLSLIASNHANNVIYFDRLHHESMVENIMFPVTMYKFIRFKRTSYVSQALFGHRVRDYSPTYYEDYISPARSEFFDTLVLMAINVLVTPTFAEIINNLRLSPAQVNSSLKKLYEGGKIKKGANSSYFSIGSFSDDALDAFSTTKLSRLRAQLISVAA